MSKMMTTTRTMNQHGRSSMRRTTAALVVGLALVAVLLMGAPPGRAAAVAPATYNDVQVVITTTNATFTGTYTVTAYNSTGYAVISYSTPYPAAAFELPSASYIFTVSADSQYSGTCIAPEPVYATGTSSETAPGVAVGASSSPASSGGGNASTMIVAPCLPGYPESEYGFSAQKVSGPTTIDIATTPVQDLKTTTVTLHVTYANGTAAAGASVYASVLGGEYYGGYVGLSSAGSSVVNMSGTVGSDGIATLIVPAVPVEVSAWNWVPVNVPASPGSTTVTVGGQKVNVSLYWEPSEVGMAGSALMVPPQTSASIVLQVQQADYWATPGGFESVSSGSAGAAASSGPASVPATVASEQAATTESAATAAASTVVRTSTVVVVDQPQSSGTAATVPAATSYSTVLLTVVGALALGIASASLIIVRRKPAI
ncbi:MAG: hypothetical protein ABSF83_10705 [Nitrososphaerales archaeon]|jgi:hypothetical protein